MNKIDFFHAAPSSLCVPRSLSFVQDFGFRGSWLLRLQFSGNGTTITVAMMHRTVGCLWSCACDAARPLAPLAPRILGHWHAQSSPCRRGPRARSAPDGWPTQQRTGHDTSVHRWAVDHPVGHHFCLTSAHH